MAGVAVSNFPIESPHQHVVDFLLSRGVSVYPVNPTAIHDYRKSRKPSGSKSDEGDAQLIASYLREHHKTLKVIFAIWKNKTSYDENLHLASIARHQLTQPIGVIA